MINFLDMDVKNLLTLVTIGNVLNSLFLLESQGVEPKLTSLLLPSFINSFGGPLLGNLVYRQFQFSTELLLVYFVSLILFPFIYKCKFLKYPLEIFPIIGKSLFYVGLKNNSQPLTNIFAYLLVSDIFSKKMNKTDFTVEDVRTIGINFFILAVIRIFDFPDHLIFAIVFCNSAYAIIKKIKFPTKLLKKTKKNLAKKEIINKEEVKRPTTPPVKKRPVRRSSIASLA